jgi:hypothetical protein
MSQIAPPESPPRIALDGDGGLGRLRFRLLQWWWTVLTVLATAWLVSLGPIPGIIAVVTAKHILVAIFVMGIGVDSTREPEN